MSKLITKLTPFVLDKNKNLIETMIELSEKYEVDRNKTCDILSYITALYERVDPIAAFKGFTPISFFYDHGIGGILVDELFLKLCKSDLTDLVAFMRGVQLGFIDIKPVLDKLITNSISEVVIDFDEVKTKINKEIPEIDFGVILPSYQYIR